MMVHGGPIAMSGQLKQDWPLADSRWANHHGWAANHVCALLLLIVLNDTFRNSKHIAQLTPVDQQQHTTTSADVKPLVSYGNSI